MGSFVPHIYTFILPMFMGNIMHMLIVKQDMFTSLAKPISIYLFGAGKTWRGFVVMPLIGGIFSLLFRTVFLHATDYGWSFAIGFILGLTYLLGELPNSYFKRKLGIGAGQSHSRYKWLQHVIDKTDSLLPMCVVYYCITTINVQMTFVLFAVSFIIHVVFSWLLYRIRVKKSF